MLPASDSQSASLVLSELQPLQWRCHCSRNRCLFRNVSVKCVFPRMCWGRKWCRYGTSELWSYSGSSVSHIRLCLPVQRCCSGIRQRTAHRVPDASRWRIDIGQADIPGCGTNNVGHGACRRNGRPELHQPDFFFARAIACLSHSSNRDDATPIFSASLFMTAVSSVFNRPSMIAILNSSSIVR